MIERPGAVGWTFSAMAGVPLAEKVVVVIGGTTGLGLSASAAFLAAGARGVVVTGRDPASAAAALARLGAQAAALEGRRCHQ